MKKFISLILVIAMFGLVAMKAEAKTYIDDPEKQIFFHSFAGRDLWGTEGEKIKAHGYLYLPDQKNNEAKSPLVILISGLGGQRGRDNRMCEALSNAGIACFGVRTYASRDIPHKSKWSKKFAIAGAGSRMYDAYSALAALSNHPSIDSKKSSFVIASRVAYSVWLVYGVSSPYKSLKNSLDAILCWSSFLLDILERDWVLAKSILS